MALKRGNCGESESEDREEEEDEEEAENGSEKGSEGDDEELDGDYDDEENNDSDDERRGGIRIGGDGNMENISNDSDSGSGATDQNNGNERGNHHDQTQTQTQSTNATAVEDEIYYSDSDPEATFPDVYGVDSDGDGEGGDDDANGDGPLPDLLPDDVYHPEHPTVRQHINELFQATLTASANPPMGAPQLVDRLVRQHLPQFWRHRFQDTNLNKHKDMTCPNGRPRSLAILSICVECGFKFCKQPLYDATQRERHWQRWKRARATKWATGRRPPRKRKPLFGAEYFKRRQGMSSSSGPSSGPGKYDNSGLTATEIDNILNNNRRSTRFDGNLDHIGLKEEHHDEDCLHNRASAKSKAKKIYMGWGLVPGHDHDASLPYHQVPPTPLYSAASTSADDTATSLLSLPEIATSFADPPIEDESTFFLPKSDCLLYPSRSLMASFCHLIPRGLVLSSNMLRKLFTYFVWHPWFDCHLQAITIRTAYSELWPLFLLRDEDAEVDDEEEDEFRKQMNALTRAKRQAAQERKTLELQADPQAGSKRKSEGKTESKKKIKLNDGNGTEANKKGKGKRKRKNNRWPVSDDDETTPPKPKIRKPRTTEELAGFERARLISLQARFTTSFNNGLSIHGIRCMSVYPSTKTRARVARQKRKGWTVFWTFPPSPAPAVGSTASQPYVIDDDQDGEGGNIHHDYCDEKDLFARRKVHCYIADVSETTRTTTSGIVHPETLFPELPDDAVLRLTNHPLTQPDREDALSRLAARLSSWFRRAHRRRVKQGFILPEYMELRPPKVKPKRKTKTQFGPRPKCKPRPRVKVMAKAKTKTKTNTSTLNDSMVSNSFTVERDVAVEPDEPINAVELVNYLTQPWSFRGQTTRGLDASSLSLTAAASSTTQLNNNSEASMASFNPLVVHNSDSVMPSTLGYRDERQLYGLMFDDMLDNPLDRPDSQGWPSGYGADLTIPNYLMALDIEEMDVDKGCFEIAHEVYDEHDGEGEVDE
ncbi:hypothetical protein EC968_005244 [Mortierella alpina]|nr:hypothetical protein EC968_005244 [Mortierella alpina]